MRNLLGQFAIGNKETPAEKEKRIIALTTAWKSRESYLGDKKYSYLYGCWRAIRFTDKGKRAGVSDRWFDFKNFYQDMIGSYTAGLKLGRINKKMPFSKDNCRWMTNEELIAMSEKSPSLEFNGTTKTLKEWALYYSLPYQGLRQRFYKGKHFSTQEILFGRTVASKKSLVDQATLKYKEKRIKASKMISSYKCKDQKRKRECDLEIDWFISNILQKSCHYCGSTNHVGADRIDHSKGHRKDNVIPCCIVCNTVRNDIFSHKEMIELGKHIGKILEDRGKQKGI